jgi:hypothetical protein
MGSQMNEQFKPLDKHGGITIGQELTIVKSGKNVGRFIKMNERIEHCLYQAGLTAQGCWDELDDYAKEGIEKFAELIVKECAYIASHNVMNISTYSDAEFVSDLITQHFGVK